MAMTKLKRNQFIPFIDVTKDLTFAASEWARVDYSTIFELTVGEQEETLAYICYENDVTEVNSNQPELPQEIAIYEGNKVYDFMAKQLYDLPTGEGVKVPFLLCFGGKDKKAWRTIATITAKVLNTVDGKITFSIKMGGDIEKGTYTISEGTPTFTAAVSS